MKEVVINGKPFLEVRNDEKGCILGNLICAFNNVSCTHVPCTFDNHQHVIFIRPDQKLDYITERLKS